MPTTTAFSSTSFDTMVSVPDFGPIEKARTWTLMVQLGAGAAVQILVEHQVDADEVREVHFGIHGARAVLRGALMVERERVAVHIVRSRAGQRVPADHDAANQLFGNGVTDAASPKRQRIVAHRWDPLTAACTSPSSALTPDSAAFTPSTVRACTGMI